MAKKKSEFYHLRKNKLGLTETKAAEVLGVGVDKVLSWDDKGAPVMAMRLLCLWDEKHVRIDGWEGFVFSRGRLLRKGKIWTPRTLLAYHDYADEVCRLRNEVAAMYSWRGIKAAVLKKIFKKNHSPRKYPL